MTKESQESKKNSGEKISLKELILKIQEWWKYLFSKWLIIIVFGITGGLIGFFYAYYKKPVYIARTTFVLENGEKVGGLSQYAGLASMVGIDLGDGGGIFQGENILELYKSRAMVQSALLSEVEIGGKKTLLIDRYIYFNSYRESLNQKKTTKNISFKLRNGEKFTRIQDSLIGIYVKQINKTILKVGKPDKKLNIIEVSAASKDEIFSKNFNEEIVKKVNDFYIITKTKKSADNLSVLQRQTDSVRNVLNGAIYASIAVADATPNLNPTRQILRASVQRSLINQEANKAMLSELVKNLELSKLTYRKELPLIQTIEQPIYPLEKEKVGKLIGLVGGGIIAGLIIVMFLIFRRIISKALSSID